MDNLSIRLAHTLALIVVIAMLSSCGSLCDDIEIERVKSPDGRVDAVLMQRNCGATTPYVFRVLLVPSGDGTKDEEPVFVADHVGGVTLSWRSPQWLDIQYKQARIFHFTSFWQSRDLDNFNYIVKIKEGHLGESG